MAQLKESQDPPVQAVTPLREDNVDTLIFNIGGYRHEVPRSTLNNIPSSLIRNEAALQAHYRKSKDDYYFDCHPGVFSTLLAYGRSGDLHVPKDLCGNLIRSELKYWGVDELEIEMCCWIKYKTDIDTKTTLLTFDKSMLSMQGRLSDAKPSSTWGEISSKMWTFFENPSSSILAKVYAAFTVVMVITSISIFCMETHPTFRQNMTVEDYADFYEVSIKHLIEDWGDERKYIENDTYAYLWNEEEIERIYENATDKKIMNSTEISNHSSLIRGAKRNSSHKHDTIYPRRDDLHKPNFILDTIDRSCMVFFSAELLLRFLFCPAKLKFCQDFLNIIDLLSILPFHIIIMVESFHRQEKYETNAFDAFYLLKVLRVFRVFRLVRHNKGLRVLVYTVKESWKEMLLLVTFILVGMVIFSSLIFFCEYGDQNGMFKSIPHGFWWSIVTMTTLGYGDIYPISDLGYLVGSMCAISGVLVIAFTVPSIVNNFILFYHHVQYAKRFKHEDEHDTTMNVNETSQHSQEHPGIKTQSKTCGEGKLQVVEVHATELSNKVNDDVVVERHTRIYPVL